MRSLGSCACIKQSQQPWGCEAYFIKLLSAYYSKLFATLQSFTFENIHPSGNFK